MFDFTELYQPRVCRECGERVTDRSRTLLCKRCMARLYAQTVRPQRRAAGLCWRCGKPLEGKYKQCEDCRRKRRAAASKRKEETTNG